MKCGSAFAPMLADKTSFVNLLADLQKRVHNDPVLIKTSAGTNKTEYMHRVAALPLPLKHPPFMAEVKLDGERMVFHYKRGVVECCTRRNNWYSQRYSPVLGPPLRKAMGSRFEGLDVIFDGEVLSWDDKKKEVNISDSQKTTPVTPLTRQFASRAPPRSCPLV